MSNFNDYLSEQLNNPEFKKEFDKIASEFKTPSAINIFNGEYFCIYEYAIPTNRKTPILRIFAKDENNSFLGEIKWFGAWRKFCFFPCENTVWDDKCLTSLMEFLKDYNHKWKKSKNNNSESKI